MYGRGAKVVHARAGAQRSCVVEKQPPPRLAPLEKAAAATGRGSKKQGARQGVSYPDGQPIGV